ncbi:F-box protein SKIP23 [Primulina huaijiensis]|uniref:F-box protein SKIP23 n=1 Tax=Primulina huaijiensis TaxID=1492673 RepID=UPI003CC71A74
MANWANLPAELLHHICEHLPTSTDLLRFRSVCPTWRSASPSPPSSASRFPILPNSGISDTTWGFYLSKRTIYSIHSAQPHDQPPWIVKLERDNSNRSHLLNPLTRSPLKPFPTGFPMFFSFFNFRVKELGQEYALQYIDFKPRANSIAEAGNLYMEKVAVISDVNNGFVLLTIHLSGKLVVYKSGDEKWRVIDDFPSPYDDVIFREGKLYAVDNSGRTVLVNYVDLSVEVVANSVFGGDKKFLVNSNGELLLVDMYLSSGPENNMDFDEWFEFYDCGMSERTLKFKVFRLDENAGRWIEVSDLGDRMLFLGENSAFSVNASDVSCKGNCILFTNHCSGRQEDEVWKGRGAGVFDLGSGSIEPIGSSSEYSKMFWPPPEWMYSIPQN